MAVISCCMLGTGILPGLCRSSFPGWRSAELREKTDGGKTVGSISESYQQVANLTLKEGRLPQEENEILLVDPENWDYQVGDQVRISYEFSYIFKQAGEVTHSLQDALLEGLNQNREYYLDLAAELWDPFVQSDSGASTLPVHMLHPMNELTAEQQDEAFLMFAALLPEFALTSAGDQHHFETKEFGKLQAYLTSGYSKTVLNGEGFGENQGTSISGGSHLSLLRFLPPIRFVALLNPMRINGMPVDWICRTPL